MIVVPLWTVKEVAAVEPKLTAVAPVKPLPEMMTCVPPAAGPKSGVILVTAVAIAAIGAFGCETTKTVESLTPVPVTWAVICCGKDCAAVHVPEYAGVTDVMLTVYGELDSE
jgi:hypothetical protein